MTNYDIYIGNSSNVIVNIDSTSNENKEGRNIFIKNNTPTPISVISEKYSIQSGQIDDPNIVSSGINASYVFVSQNQLLRLS